MAIDIATPSFGFADDGKPFNNGVRPHIAMNNSGVFVTTFSSDNNYMYYAVGALDGLAVDLQAAEKLKNKDTGDTGHSGFIPAVTISPDDLVVEMHVNNKSKTDLWYSWGKLSGDPGARTVSWSKTERYRGSADGKNDAGRMPALSNVTPDNYFLELHQDTTGVVNWTLGKTGADGITWQGKQQKLNCYGKDVFGNRPVAAISGTTVVELHEHDGHLYAVIGTLDTAAGTIVWHVNIGYDTGHSPSLFLTDDGLIYEFHEGDSQKLWQRVGKITGSGKTTAITWYNWLGQVDDGVERTSYEYDINYTPMVARHGTVAVQVCADGNSDGNHKLFCSASYLIKRGYWMTEHIPGRPEMTLRNTCMPASHDAGMYTGTLAKVARTQNLNILGQCLAGSRYFDIRPTLSGGTYYCYHNFDDTMLGAKIQDVLDLVKTYVSTDTGGWGARELIVLKLSHYGNGMQPKSTDAVFMAMLKMVTDTLGSWLCPPPPAGTRLADLSLADLLKTDGCVLVVCDGFDSGYASGGTPVVAKIYGYRDWQDPTVKSGDLTVFDIYSDTTDLEEMINGLDASEDHSGPEDVPYLPNGQVPKYQGPGVAGQKTYDGFTRACAHDATAICDLFLLSWTLTPITDVWDTCQPADATLATRIPPPPANRPPINLLYVDYVSYSRAADVACLRNGFIT